MSKPTYLSTTKVFKKDYIEGESQWLRFPYPREKGTHFYYLRAFSQEYVTKRSNYAFLCLQCDKSKIDVYEKVLEQSNVDVSHIKIPQFEAPKIEIPKLEFPKSEEPTVKDKVIQKLIKYGLMAGFFVVLCGIGFIVYKCHCQQSRARRQISYPIQPRNQNQEQREQKEIKVDIPKISIPKGSDSKDQEDSKDEEEHQPFVSVQ